MRGIFHKGSILCALFCLALWSCSSEKSKGGSAFDRFDKGSGSYGTGENELIDPSREQNSASAERVPLRTFNRCRRIRITCVVDGDTFWLKGVKIRIADIDTPELTQAQCAAEKVNAELAADRLVELLNDGPFELRSIGSKDVDQYGRKLRVVLRDGQSLGSRLIEEGLARDWNGKREPWC